MKRLLLVSLVLAMMLTLVIPSVTMAAPKPSNFLAQGTISSIDAGTVKQLGNSGKWLVTDRHLDGTLSGSLSGSYELTYGGVFDLQTQAGNLAGILKNGSSSFGVEGKSAPLFLTNGIPTLTVSGHWVGLKGVSATGDFTATIYFIPTADGHIGYIFPFSSFIMAGKYNNGDQR